MTSARAARQLIGNKSLITRYECDKRNDRLSSALRRWVSVTKEFLAAIADTSISGRRAARELDAVIAWRGKPDLIVSDHGTEFTSNAMPASSRTRRMLLAPLRKRWTLA